MFCEKCGVKLPENSKFCVSCGAHVGGAGAVQAPIPPPPVTPVSPQTAAPTPFPPPPPPGHGRAAEAPPPPPGYQPEPGQVAPSAPPVYRPPGPVPSPGPMVQGPPSYAPQPAYGTGAQAGTAVLSVGQYIVMFILLCIPIVNMILLFVWSFGSAAPLNKKNFARAVLIMGAVSLILWIIAGGAIMGILSGMMGGYY